jgi:DNA repair exonuclease SbcCD ATPase subunit
MEAEPPSGRWPLWAAVVLLVAWMAAIGFALASGAWAARDPTVLVGLCGAAVVPAALLALAAASARMRPAAPARPAADDREMVEQAESRIAAAATRIAALRDSLEADVGTLGAVTAAFEQAGARAAAAAEALAGLLPAADHVQQHLEPLLERSTALLATLQPAFERIEAAAARSEAAAAAAVDGAEAGAAAMAGSVTVAEQLAERAQQLEARVQTQAAAIDALAVGAERSFQLLDARIAHRETSSQKSLERLAERIAALHAEAEALSAPLDAGRERIAALGSGLEQVRQTAIDAHRLLDDKIPAAAASATAGIASAAAAMAPLETALDTAATRVDALTVATGAAGAAIAAAAAAHGEQRAAIEAAAQAVVVELNQARLLLAEVERQAESTALGAATRLVDQMAQVHEVAGGTAAAVRTALDRAIEQARGDLSATVRGVLEQDFAEPLGAALRRIDEQATAASDAGRRAAERTAAALVGLADALARIERRAAERQDEADRVDAAGLAAAAALLTDRMAAEAVGIASALDRPMDDASWKVWRQGERGLFGRRALQLLDRRDARELKRLLQQDATFADLARRYTSQFEALLRRVDMAGAGPLSLLLLSSEPGRLAAALAEALGD